MWRRRKCSQCSNVFTTLEAIDGQRSIMIDTGKQAEPVPFLRDKLFISIYESCKHRPSATEDASALTDTIISKVLSKHNPTVAKDNIKTSAYKVLKRFDQSAAVYYKAYYCK